MRQTFTLGPAQRFAFRRIQRFLGVFGHCGDILAVFSRELGGSQKRALDASVQISAFVKLKLTNCARRYASLPGVFVGGRS
jgi:hypothetical protein